MTAPVTAPEAVHRQAVPGFGTVTVRPLDPAGDAALVHGWVNEERSRFWGMVGHSQDEVREIYAYVDSLDTHYAYIVERDGTPVALFQTYQPEHDPVGECYPVQPGDFGVHLLLAPAGGEPAPGFTAGLVAALMGYVFADPAHRRVVAEPDALNEKSIARVLRTGFELGPLIDLPDKRAQLVFLTRESVAHVLAARP
ncbi:RimJ/RimL family protein N-acetyltransferase [Streptomyces sp. TLI_235]|nr:GNAT family N-acetyltransferase [Streptomyces sp. TLI_235]PBC67433.1 RimJ/RimL family protein N-acetyltransferase [Streptomyces sp. TLI_235]